MFFLITFALNAWVLSGGVSRGIERLASDAGHIVLRVSPGGGEFRVLIVDHTTESHNVVNVFGPYPSR